MKTLLKLVVVVVVLNGAYRFGMAEYRSSQLKDATHSMLALGTQTPIEQLKEQILKKSAELGLTVSPDSVSVTRDGVKTMTSVAFQQEVEVFPGYKDPRDYSFTDEISAFR